MIEQVQAPTARRGQGDATLDRRPGGDAFVPRAQMGVGAEIEADDAGDMGPAEVRDIGNRIVFARDMGMPRQLPVEHAERGVAQATVAFDRLGLRGGGENLEVHALANDGTDAGRMKHQPLDRLPARLGSIGNNRRVLSAVQQDRRRLEQGDAGGMIHQHRDATVRIEPQESRPPVFACVDMHVPERIGQAQFLQCDGDLETIGELSVYRSIMAVPRPGQAAGHGLQGSSKRSSRFSFRGAGNSNRPRHDGNKLL